MNLILSLLVSSISFAQMVEVKDEKPPAGKEKAAEYFQSRKQTAAPEGQEVTASADPRYLALHIGTFLDGDAYKWGSGDQTDVGKLNLGVTYRMGEWVNSMDLLFRAEFTSYELDEGTTRKLGFLMLVTFPDANSRFPLYFGAGLGPGFFIKQIPGESTLSLDYQLIVGARVFNVIDTVGFNVELGAKNELHLLKDGQFNGLFFGVGTVFSF